MKINNKYTEFYNKITAKYVYPTEFVVRTFLANYPNLKYKKPKQGDKVLDIACGDGRNTRFLCEQGYDVYGTEITNDIIEQTNRRLLELGLNADLREGRNSNLPFEDNFFNYILAAAVIYYIDEGNTLKDNLEEYCRVLKSGGYLIASIANVNSYVFKNSLLLEDGSRRVANDPYNNRVGYRLHGFKSEEDIKDYLSPYFTDFSFGIANNNFYGIDERLFYVVCKKK